MVKICPRWHASSPETGSYARRPCIGWPSSLVGSSGLGKSRQTKDKVETWAWVSNSKPLNMCNWEIFNYKWYVHRSKGRGHYLLWIIYVWPSMTNLGWTIQEIFFIYLNSLIVFNIIPLSNKLHFDFERLNRQVYLCIYAFYIPCNFDSMRFN